MKEVVKMTEIAEILSNYGVGAIIICLFIYDWLTNKKDIKNTLTQNNKFLTEINNSSSNTAKSLDLLQQTIDAEKQALLTHDKRCEEIQKIVKEIQKELKKKEVINND